MQRKMPSLLISVALLLASIFTAATTPVCETACTPDHDNNIFDCSNCGCTIIPKTPDDSHPWKTILLSNNSIDNIFPLQTTFPSAVVLDLSNNEIRSIDENAFKGLGSLKILNISNNNLGSFDLNLLGPVDFLEELYLQSNYINDLKGMANLDGLKKLDLSDNNLGEINQALQGFSSLKFLNLTSNQLKAVDRRDYNALGWLKELYLADNDINSMAFEAFEKCDMLKILDLRYNYISVLNEAHFKGLVNLETLYLTANRLESLDTSVFTSLISLQTLVIELNPIEKFTVINDKLLPPSLQTVVIHKTSIAFIENGTFSQLCSLTTVNITQNEKLQSLEAGIFDGCTVSTVRYLDISNNALATLDPNLLIWDALVSVNATGNNWVCDCSISWMKNSSVLTAAGDTFSCSQPPYLRGDNLATVSLQQLDCNFMNRLKGRVGKKVGVWMIMIVTVTFITMLSYLVYKNRRRLLPSSFRNSDKYATLYNAADMDDSTITLHRADELNEQRNKSSAAKPEDV